VRRGLYIGVPVDAADPAGWSEDPLVVAAEVWPGYFTGWTAAGEWSLTDQVFRTTVLKTTARIRASSVRLLDHEYLLSPVDAADLAWGMKNQWHSDVKLRFADPARTLIDILDTPRLGGGMRHGAEMLAAYVDAYDPATLLDYGGRLGNASVFKRLGYCLETLQLTSSDIVEACHDRISSGISPLDPDGPRDGRVMTRWNVRVNVTIAAEDPS
jgi:predicted transcriptional regulator of viral defense system